MGQPDLFDRLPRPLPPHHKDGPATERAAARSVIGSARSLRARMYQFIKQRGSIGATRDELDRAFCETPNVTQPRLVELEGCSIWCIKRHQHLPALIEKSERTRVTRKGRKATVYVTREP